MKQPKTGKLIACLAVLVCGPVLAEETSPGTIKPLSAVQFAPDKDVKCLSAALETGDPATGRSTIILQARPGCVVPWHFHTAEEQLIIVSGTVLAEMAGHPPTKLGPGGFAMMGGRMAHQFTCQGRSACLMFVAFDRAYDIFWGKGG
jgi:mannose-6-phosphate isomerase-like protein (cupin superfamily)